MSTVESDAPALRQPLRLWPGVVLVAIEWLAWWVGPNVLPGNAKAYAAIFGLLVGAVGVPIWWVFFSRAARIERWGALGLVIAALALTPPFLHRSVAEGNMGIQYFAYAIPLTTLALVAWAAATRTLSNRVRRATMVVSLLAPSALFLAVRSEGLTGDGRAQFVWRWSPTPEERLLARAPESLPVDTELEVAGEIRAEWPGFRGPDRDGVVTGVAIETDWETAPPVELWSRSVGPGVSSFAVGGGLVYTQEQRGDEEIVSCYELATGEPVWRHHEPIRFWDSHVGAGPRATPTLADGRIYALGATGLLNALAAGDGSVLWSRDAAADADAIEHSFGYTGSPLVVDDLVVVALGARLVAYDTSTGEPRWLGPDQKVGYSSPQLLTIDGVEQIVLMTGEGAIAVSPPDGSLLWEHAWPGIGIVQPAVADDTEVLVSQSSDFAASGGIRRLAVERRQGEWSVREAWTSHALEPSFSPFVVDGGHAYGFDGHIMAAVDLATGERVWKGGRYGAGQVLLLADQDLLLVVSERGELALVEARPERFHELARVPAIEGRTWNQPALAGRTLLVRNGREMAAFELAAGDR